MCPTGPPLHGLSCPLPTLIYKFPQQQWDPRLPPPATTLLTGSMQYTHTQQYQNNYLFVHWNRVINESRVLTHGSFPIGFCRCHSCPELLRSASSRSPSGRLSSFGTVTHLFMVRLLVTLLLLHQESLRMLRFVLQVVELKFWNVVANAVSCVQKQRILRNISPPSMSPFLILAPKLYENMCFQWNITQL